MKILEGGFKVYYYHQFAALKYLSDFYIPIQKSPSIVPSVIIKSHNIPATPSDKILFQQICFLILPQRIYPAEIYWFNIIQDPLSNQLLLTSLYRSTRFGRNSPIAKDIAIDYFTWNFGQIDNHKSNWKYKSKTRKLHNYWVRANKIFFLKLDN